MRWCGEALESYHVLSRVGVLARRPDLKAFPLVLRHDKRRPQRIELRVRAQAQPRFAQQLDHPQGNGGGAGEAGRVDPSRVDQTGRALARLNDPADRQTYQAVSGFGGLSGR